MTEQKRKKAELVKLLIAAGWNPPTPTSHIVARIAEDMEQINAIEESRPDRWKPTLDLTPKQSEIVSLLADGYSRDEIAAKTNKSVETIKTQLKDIFRKLGAKNAAHAVAIYLRNTRSVELEQAA